MYLEGIPAVSYQKSNARIMCFLRAYDAYGNKVGSSACKEGRIFIEPQGFCTLAGIGGKEYGLKAMESTRNLLLEEDGVDLLYPCYTEYHVELGEITSYPPGFKENGSVFCHNNPWIVCAEAELGRGNEAFDIYRRICLAYLEDGGGASIWRTFTHTPGKIAYGDTGDIACDSYHRYAEDIALLKELGVKAYRFSTSWARIDPNGDGNWNQAGLAYYDKVVDACLAAGIVPYMTLYHWELPQSVQDRGGWCEEETACAFGRFAGMMAQHFRDRVRNYFTLNEPQCTTSLGYFQGIHAPGLQLKESRVFSCHVHQMMAHGLALRAIKAADPGATVGIASTGNLCYPETESPENIEAARQATFATDPDNWIFTHHWLLDPILFGRFPDCTGTRLEALVKKVSRRQMEIIHAVPDMLGYNIYNGHEVRATESGADIRGYFHWSATDNLEWHSGYGDRFGLIYMDFSTGQRLPKDSFYWYQNVILTGTVSFALPES